LDNLNFLVVGGGGGYQSGDRGGYQSGEGGGGRGYQSGMCID